MRLPPHHSLMSTRQKGDRQFGSSNHVLEGSYPQKLTPQNPGVYHPHPLLPKTAQDRLHLRPVPMSSWEEYPHFAPTPTQTTTRCRCTSRSALRTDCNLRLRIPTAMLWTMPPVPTSDRSIMATFAISSIRDWIMAILTLMCVITSSAASCMNCLLAKATRLEDVLPGL